VDAAGARKEVAMARGRALRLASLMILCAAVWGAATLHSEATSTQKWDMGADFSGTQGQRNWCYQEWTGTAYRDMRFDAQGNRWTGEDELCILGSDWAHPSAACDPARKWVSPAAGTVAVVGSAHDMDPAGGDGVEVVILKGDSALWSQTVANGDTTGQGFNISFAVQAGDAVYFRVNKRVDSGWDTTYLTATIELSASGAPASETSAPETPAVAVAPPWDCGHMGGVSFCSDTAHASCDPSTEASPVEGSGSVEASIDMKVMAHERLRGWAGASEVLAKTFTARSSGPSPIVVSFDYYGTSRFGGKDVARLSGVTGWAALLFEGDALPGSAGSAKLVASYAAPIRRTLSGSREDADRAMTVLRDALEDAYQGLKGTIGAGDLASTIVMAGTPEGPRNTFSGSAATTLTASLTAGKTYTVVFMAVAVSEAFSTGQNGKASTSIGMLTHGVKATTP
jgi:hypothetical protein